MDDFGLIKAFLSGDEKAFDAIVERYKDKIINFIFRTTRNLEESEDLSQQVFLNLYLGVKKFRFKCKFSTYLFTIATNIIRKVLKRMERKYSFISLEQPITEDGNTLSEIIASSDRGQDKQLKSRERVKKILEAIESLPHELYLVYTLSEDEEMNYKEIAEAVKVPVGTVASRKNTAVRILRDKLKDVWEEVISDGLR